MGKIVTTAEPDTDGFTWDTAVIVTVVVVTPPFPLDVVGTPPGATYKPELEIKPNCWLPPAMPLTCQVTALLERLLGMAMNCCVVNMATFTGFGLTAMEGITGITVTVAVPNCVVSTCEIAFTVTCAGLGTVAGAV